MKKFQLSLFLGGILALLGFGCEEGGKLTKCELAACDPGRKTVKQWVNEKGTVEFDRENQMYVINVGYTVVIHVVRYVCDLAEALKKEGMQFVVSGKLKDDCDELKIIFVSQENYYLHIGTIETLKD